MRLTALVLLVIAGWLLPSPALAQRCNSTTSQNQFVRDVLNEYYFWYRELPALNPANFASPEAFLEAARYRPLDQTFSYITSRAANEAFYGESQFVGFGFSQQTQEEAMRVLHVYPDSPAAEAGLARGDRIFEIEGRTVAQLIAAGTIGSVFGASDIGVSRSIAFRTRDGAERRATMTKRVVTIPTVSLTRTFRVDGRTVGYLMFRNFVTPSYQALDDAFAALREAGATELVLDLRYNGGGLVDVAVHLASLIAGARYEGRIFATYQHNDQYPSLNKDLRFGSGGSQALDLARLFVITTRSSASASELVINSLRPYIPVTVIGEATYGKPVGQYGFNFCDKVLAPVSFKLVNAQQQAEFFDGIQPDCRAADDADNELGSASEGSLAEALHVIRTGACSAPVTSGAARAVSSALPRAVGWDAVINAH